MMSIFYKGIFVVFICTLLTYNTGNYQGYKTVSFRLLYLQPLLNCNEDLERLTFFL